MTSEFIHIQKGFINNIFSRCSDKLNENEMNML